MVPAAKSHRFVPDLTGNTNESRAPRHSRVWGGLPVSITRHSIIGAATIIGAPGKVSKAKDFTHWRVRKRRGEVNDANARRTARRTTTSRSYVPGSSTSLRCSSGHGVSARCAIAASRKTPRALPYRRVDQDTRRALRRRPRWFRVIIWKDVWLRRPSPC